MTSSSSDSRSIFGFEGVFDIDFLGFDLDVEDFGSDFASLASFSACLFDVR